MHKAQQHLTAQTTTLPLLKRSIVVVPCRCFAVKLIYHSLSRHGVVCANVPQTFAREWLRKKEFK